MTQETEDSGIPVFRTPREAQEWARRCRADGKTIGCVPTMGALHEGHLSLVRKSADECDETIVTIFVNPLQFAPSEDLDKYPRDERNDLKLSEENGATAAYCPSVDTMYKADRSVFVVEESLSKVLCGKSRPIHFRGVLTVVAKLFNACFPDKAYFGQKDYQQLLIVRRMVRDLDFPVEVVSCPIVRESDGLAMSSRNRYLSPQERVDARSLSVALSAAEAVFVSGERNPRAIERVAREIIEPVESAKIDYIECRDAETLWSVNEIERPVVLALAVFIGETRLIDNIVLNPDKEG